MSNQFPGSPSEMEHLQVTGRPARSHPPARRQVAAIVIAAVSVGAVAAGVWAWQAWASQGPQPAEALPGTTLAYVALDLEPPGQQKLAAYNTLRKFPSIRKDLGLDSADDLSKSVVEELASEGDCDLDRGDVKGWAGDRVAFAVVEHQGPEPVVVVQVADAGQARSGLAAIARRCDFGFSVAGDWAVLARDSGVARQVTEDAGRRNLANDREFRELTSAAGDPGLVTLYAAPESGPALLDAIEKDPFIGWMSTWYLSSVFDPMTSLLTTVAMPVLAEQSFDDDFVEQEAVSEEPEISPEMRKAEAELMERFEHFEELSEKEQERLLRDQQKLYQEMYGLPEYDADFQGEYDEEYEGDDEDEFAPPGLDADLRASLRDFTGLGGVGRFADGGLEIEVVGDSLRGTTADLYDGHAGRDLVSGLPGDTAIALGGGLAEQWVDGLIGQLTGQSMYSFMTLEEDLVAAFEKSTGLDLPGDLEALGLDSISVVAGDGFSPEVLGEDPARVPMALRLDGDPDRVEATLEKLRVELGPDGSSGLLSRRVGDDVVVGPDRAYLDQLAEAGDDLADSDRFDDVVPEADGATTVAFLDFDAGDWLAKLAESDGAREDAEPLDAAGFTMTKDDDRQRILLRVSFD